MKKYLIQLVLLIGFSNLALAQSSDTNFSKSGGHKDSQISDANYKHPNKAAEARKKGLDHHSKAGSTVVTENGDYKRTFKNKSNVNKAAVQTESPAGLNKMKSKKNYKQQF